MKRMIVVQSHRAARSVRGLSLVELMIALTISVLLGLGLVQVFSAQRVAYASNESLARLQENSRFAMNFLQHDLRMTGHMACLNELGFRGRIYNHLSADTPDAAPWMYRIDKPFEVFEATDTAPGELHVMPEKRSVPGAGHWKPALPDALDIADEALDGSDVIVVRYLSETATVLTGAGVNGETGTMEIVDPDFVEANGIYAISDCKNFSLFQAKSAGPMVVADNGGLNLVGWSGRENTYGPDVPLRRYEVAAYYVATGADGNPALFRSQLSPSTGKMDAGEELVAGVEMLQAVLGADVGLRDGGDLPTDYFTAADIEDGGGPWPGTSTATTRWSAVVSVRLGVLVRGGVGSAVEKPEKPLRVADTGVTPPDDAHLRHTYEVQIALRNRIRG